MTVGTGLGPVSAYIQTRLVDLLNERRVVVWYDPAEHFARLLDRLDLPSTVIVCFTGSSLRARREAEAIYRQIGVPDTEHYRSNLLIYLPLARGPTAENQRQDPFEFLARCGDTFGDTEAQFLRALAQLALPARADEVTRFFRDGEPTLETLDALPAGAQYPLVRQSLGTDSAVDVIARAIAYEETQVQLDGVPGSLAELNRLAQTELDLPQGPAQSWSVLRERLATYLLVSELAFDLPGGLPNALSTVPHAPETYRQRVLDICDRLRETDAGRESYSGLARKIEQDIRLSSVLGESLSLGDRDTFPCQERARLHAVVRAAVSSNLSEARQLERTSSAGTFWQREPERRELWQAVRRCLEFLDVATQMEKVRPKRDGVRLQRIVEQYIAPEGGWRLDRTQRLFEQAAAICAQDDEIEALVEVCRRRYWEVVTPIQTTFQLAVQAEGWPPEGVRRLTQTFQRHVDGALNDRRKTAYFLVDSLRYEMGRDLGEALEDLGAVTTDAAAAVLPTSTEFGMAALLPAADGSFTYVKSAQGDLYPAIGDTPLPDVRARINLLQRRFGDRYLDIKLEDVVSTPSSRLTRQTANRDLIVVRSQEIDALGEGPSSYQARKTMTDIIQDLRTAALRLVAAGCRNLVFAADHGHVFVPEIRAGDVVSPPDGDWLVHKRRARLGFARASAPGVLVLKAQDMGIAGPVEDLAVPLDFKTFQAGSGYFHEGLSLQECIVPVVSVLVPVTAEWVGGQVEMSYHRDRFTSSVVNVKVRLVSAGFGGSIAVRIEAFDSGKANAAVVGKVEDGEGYDQRTGEITLRPEQEVTASLLVSPDFHGDEIDLRATDPRTGQTLHRLTLKNGRLE